ncbi:MAG TPA: bacillithiol biosynthesis cysteine-adding enzyme BshC [Flavobacteriales bacterium]|nr:bacillithiol biosynthesis cysteine-adding enzyme BshC [Flavobacteriales bacterium]
MIEKQHIPYSQTPLLSPIMKDFTCESESLSPFYIPYSNENLQSLIQQKKRFFGKDKRTLLHAELLKQYQGFELSEQTKNNIDLLLNENTFTITTGHQLNLFGGPLYFIYKIISVVNFAKKLKNQYPEYNFVPVFWMASEDHDFEEINHFYLNNKLLAWNRKTKGAVGRLSTEGLEKIYHKLANITGDSINTKKIQELFRNAYLAHNTLSAATHYFVNQLFKDQGLVIIDADNRNLKKEFIPVIKQDIFENTSFKQINIQSDKLKKLYNKTQINARPVNFFYLKDNIRERIEKNGNTYKVINSDISFSDKELASEIDNYPERFSPNVALRPMYQETILPNLAYIGGGGELAYWLQLKKAFETYKIPFPFLFLRNSALWLDKKSVRYINKLQLQWQDIFLPENELTKKILTSKNTIPFNTYKQEIEDVFRHLEKDITTFDKSLRPSILASQTRINKELNRLEKKVLRNLKRRETETLQKINYLNQTAFPKGVLQERIWNFSTLYLEYGNAFFTQLLNEFDIPSKEILIFYPNN